MILHFDKEDLIKTSEIRQYFSDFPRYKRKNNNKYTLTLMSYGKAIKTYNYATLTELYLKVGRSFSGARSSVTYNKVHAIKSEPTKIKLGADSYLVTKNY